MHNAITPVFVLLSTVHTRENVALQFCSILLLVGGYCSAYCTGL